jgi:hypothetical protein
VVPPVLAEETNGKAPAGVNSFMESVKVRSLLHMVVPLYCQRKRGRKGERRAGGRERKRRREEREKDTEGVGRGRRSE